MRSIVITPYSSPTPPATLCTLHQSWSQCLCLPKVPFLPQYQSWLASFQIWAPEEKLQGNSPVISRRIDSPVRELVLSFMTPIQARVSPGLLDIGTSGGSDISWDYIKEVLKVYVVAKNCKVLDKLKATTQAEYQNNWPALQYSLLNLSLGYDALPMARKSS